MVAEFLPGFGNRPEQLVGRDHVVMEFLDGLSGPPGHPYRACFYLGQHGMGKTALLLELAVRAEAKDFVVARVAASEKMLDEILQLIQLDGARSIPKESRVRSVSAGALGFSFGLTFSDEVKRNYGFRVKLGLLCDELAKHRKGVLLLVDEVTSNTPQMRELATSYQHLVGEGKNIAIAMAGLPTSISNVLNDDVLTFLNRSHKVTLGPIPLSDIAAYYRSAFQRAGKTITGALVERAAEATRGYPYLLQLLGFHLMQFAADSAVIDKEILALAISTAKRELVETIYQPSLRPLSDKDIAFLRAMSVDDGESAISDIRKRIGASNEIAQLYRARLIAAGVVDAPRRGKLEFKLPYLGEYLRETKAVDS